MFIGNKPAISVDSRTQSTQTDLTELLIVKIICETRFFD